MTTILKFVDYEHVKVHNSMNEIHSPKQFRSIFNLQKYQCHYLFAVGVVFLIINKSCSK